MIRYGFVKALTTIIITVLMQAGIVSSVTTTPHEAVTEFMDGLKSGDTAMMEKYLDNQYINLLMNVSGDEAVVDRLYSALFEGFSYEIVEILEKNDVAVAEVNVRGGDFSGVMDAYSSASYEYVTDNLYSDSIADKDALNAKCLEIYVEQTEAAAASGSVREAVVYVPMTDDRFFGWNILVTDEMMAAVLGGLQIPVIQ